MERIDILGLGAVAVDDLVYVESYPPANTKARVLDRERQCGGLTATALVAAARLGCRCAYAGLAGTDQESEFALEAMAGAGIDVASAGRHSDRRVYHSTVIVDRLGQRTLLSDGRNVEGADDNWPAEEILRVCKVLFVDHTAPAGMARAARIAQSAGIPVVADIERAESGRIDELMRLVDHLIVPEHFARAATSIADAGSAAVSLMRDNRKAVVVTCGERGSWFVGRGCSLAHQDAYAVHTVDTTGCGDVFHGAYAAGLVMGKDLPARVRLASAAAALKATRRGGQAGCPTMEEVRSFLADRVAP
jgi:sugar/nucleoside kinase (ribokinase family)